MEFLFARHGESDANTRKVFANRGEDDFPLTSWGRQQARTLAHEIQPAPVTHVYVSPLLRARETAMIVAVSRARPLPVHAAPALREYDVGWFEGQPYGGDLQARLHGFVRQLMRDHDPTATILLVGHGGLYRVALPGLLENVSFDFAHRHPIEHCTVIRARADVGSLVCESWGAQCPP